MFNWKRCTTDNGRQIKARYQDCYQWQSQHKKPTVGCTRPIHQTAESSSHVCVVGDFHCSRTHIKHDASSAGGRCESNRHIKLGNNALISYCCCGGCDRSKVVGAYHVRGCLTVGLPLQSQRAVSRYARLPYCSQRVTRPTGKYTISLWYIPWSGQRLPARLLPFCPDFLKLLLRAVRQSGANHLQNKLQSSVSLMYN